LISAPVIVIDEVLKFISVNLSSFFALSAISQSFIYFQSAIVSPPSKIKLD
jgi:hypothetical protein